jgi:stearoyl-CoA desaturase (Delta-9 desaturase)
MKYLDPDKLFSSSAKMKFNFLLAFVIIIYWCLTNFSIVGMALGAVSYVIVGKIGGDVAMHRYFSHRSFQTTQFWDWALKIMSVMIGHGSMFLWTITHRAHHKDSDSDKDPHPPNVAGITSVFLRTWSSNFTPSANFGKDLLKDSSILFIHKNYFKIFYIWLFLLFLLGDAALLYLFAFPCLGFFLETGLVNTICHRYGHAKYVTNDQSTNNILVNFLTLGNGMHNTHHKHQSLYTTDFGKWYEFDLMKYFINAIRT